MRTPTELVDLQSALGLSHVHVAEIAEDGWTLAHTDDEREEWGTLTNCPLGLWLAELDSAPAEPGVYVVEPHEPDQYSEPYGAQPWEFCLLEDVDVAG